MIVKIPVCIFEDVAIFPSKNGWEVNKSAS